MTSSQPQQRMAPLTLPTKTSLKMSQRSHKNLPRKSLPETILPQRLPSPPTRSLSPSLPPRSRRPVAHSSLSQPSRRRGKMLPLLRRETSQLSRSQPRISRLRHLRLRRSQPSHRIPRSNPPNQNRLSTKPNSPKVMLSLPLTEMLLSRRPETMMSPPASWKRASSTSSSELASISPTLKTSTTLRAAT